MFGRESNRHGGSRRIRSDRTLTLSRTTAFVDTPGGNGPPNEFPAGRTTNGRSTVGRVLGTCRYVSEKTRGDETFITVLSCGPGSAPMDRFLEFPSTKNLRRNGNDVTTIDETIENSVKTELYRAIPGPLS